MGEAGGGKEKWLLYFNKNIFKNHNFKKFSSGISLAL